MILVCHRRKPRHFSTLLDLAGVYVIRFPDRIKVGQTLHARNRLVAHLDNGAQDATLFEVEPNRDRGTPSWPLRELERRAINTIERLGSRVRGTEEFLSVSYRDAVRAVRALDEHLREIEFPNLPELRWILRAPRLLREDTR